MCHTKVTLDYWSYIEQVSANFIHLSNVAFRLLYPFSNITPFFFLLLRKLFDVPSRNVSLNAWYIFFKKKKIPEFEPKRSKEETSFLIAREFWGVGGRIGSKGVRGRGLVKCGQLKDLNRTFLFELQSGGKFRATHSTRVTEYFAKQSPFHFLFVSDQWHRRFSFSFFKV